MKNKKVFLGTSISSFNGSNSCSSVYGYSRYGKGKGKPPPPPPGKPRFPKLTVREIVLFEVTLNVGSILLLLVFVFVGFAVFIGFAVFVGFVVGFAVFIGFAVNSGLILLPNELLPFCSCWFSRCDGRILIILTLLMISRPLPWLFVWQLHHSFIFILYKSINLSLLV